MNEYTQKSRVTKYRYIIIAVFIILTILVLVFSFSKINKTKLVCGSAKCPTGCCTGNICQVKGADVSGYSCLGDNKWRTSDGKVVNKIPDDVVEKINNITVTTIPAIFSKNNLVIAQNILVKLNAQKNSDGIYYFDQFIKDDLTADQSVTDFRVGVYPMWAKFISWRKTQNPELLKQIEKDLDIFNDKNKVRSYQPDFWGCKLLYEIWIESSVSQSIKDKAKNLCERAEIYIPALKKEGYLWSYTVINNISENDLDTVFTKVGPTVTPKVIQIGEETEPGLHKLSAHTSDFAVKYIWDKNNNNLVIAKALFNLAVEVYGNHRSGGGFVPGECILGEAAVDLYKAAKDQKYFDFALKLFEKDNLYETGDLFEKTTCIFFGDSLGKITNDKKFIILKNDLLNSIYENNYENDLNLFCTRYGKNRVCDTQANGLISTILLMD